jgi:hypothetical protein
LSASAELVCIHPSQLRDVWPLVADRIRSAVLRTDLSHTADIKRDLFEGDGLLWVIHDGAAIEAAAATLLVKTDRHLVCIITAIGGGNMRRWLPLLDQVEAWAKAEGAALVRIVGRPGWVRVLKNYRVKNVVLERLL